jgi:hypothetical protein
MLMAAKNNQGKTVQLRGVVRRILVLKLKTAKETLMELMNTVMEIMSMEKIVKNPVPMKIIMEKLSEYHHQYKKFISGPHR